MWFDYQALFDQTKNWVLHYDFKIKEFETVQVQHTDFEQNILARKALLGEKIDDTLINDVCSGFVPTIGKVLVNLFEYIICFILIQRTTIDYQLILGSYWLYVHNFHMVRIMNIINTIQNQLQFIIQ